MHWLSRYLFLTVLILLFLYPWQVLSSHEPANADSYFEMSLKELLDVEVLVSTAGKAPEKIAEIPASVVLIEREDIENYGYMTLAEILGHIPGLFPTNDYSWDGVNFGVRGFWSGVVNRNMIILVNGVNQIMDYQANFSLTNINIPVEAIDRIEVIRGPMSVIYGTGAFFGVINIITNESTQFNHVNIVSGAVGSHDTKKALVRSTGKEDKFQYVLNASLFYTNGIDQPLNQMISTGSTDHTGGKLENQEKYFNFSGKLDRLSVDFSYTEAMLEHYLSSPSVSDGGANHVKRLNIGLGYYNQVNNKFSLNGKLCYHSAHYEALYDLIVENADFGQNVGASAFEADIYGLIKLNKSIELTSGIYYRSVFDMFNELVAPILGNPIFNHQILTLKDGERVSTQAFYSQANISVTSKWRIVVGARIERMPRYTFQQRLSPEEAFMPMSITEAHYDYNKIAIIPRIAALYTLSDNHLIKFLYGEAINRPSFQQNVDKFLGIQRDLEPERIQTYEINYMGSFVRGFTSSISLYRNEMNNLLIRDHGLNADGTYYSYFSNAGKMLTHGAEVTLRIEPVKNLLFDMSTTYQTTKDQMNQDVDVAFSPNWLSYLKASYHYRNLNVALTGRYVDTMKSYWDPVMQNADGSIGGRIGRNVPGYVSLGANIRLKNCIQKGTYINIRVNNLLDEDIFYPTFTNNPWADQGTMDWGRRWLVTFGYQF